MKSILNSVFLVAAIALLSVNVMAQTTPVPTTTPTYPVIEQDDADDKDSDWWTGFTASGEEKDMVTVGSRMPYMVEAQVFENAPEFTFQYKWDFSAGDIQTLSGGTLTVVDNDYYTANTVSVVMPTTSGTTITIKTNVRTVSSGVALCEGDELSYEVEVVGAPEIAWTETNPEFTGVCVEKVTIPVDIEFDADINEPKIEISFTITPTGGATTTYYLVVDDSASEFEIPGSYFTGSSNGKFEIELVSITDRISRKSLVAITGEVPSVPYTVTILPAPTTKPLQHIRNVNP